MAEYDGRGRSRGANPLAEFDAFRARRVAEQEADGAYEATARIYDDGSGNAAYDGTAYGDAGYEYGYGFPDRGAAEPTRLVAAGHKQTPGGRGKLRSTAVLLAVALFAVGLAAGVYAATRSANTGSKAASSSTGRSASPSASAVAPANTNGGGMAPGMGSTMAASPSMSVDTGMGTGMGMGSGTDPMGTPAPGMSQPATSGATHSTLAQLAVLDVAGNSFTALTSSGAVVEIQVNGQTRFGTSTQPFSAADLVPGTQVMARVKRNQNGRYVATMITGIGGADQPSAQMSPTGDTSGGNSDGNSGGNSDGNSGGN